MAARTATITLGGVQYVVHPFNIDELEQIGDLLGNTNPTNAGLGILKIALKRSDPPVPDPGKLEIGSMAEVTEATRTLMELAGLKTESPQQVAPAS